MILLDSLHINSGGGKILLGYLVRELEKDNLQIFYLFDERVAKDFEFIPKSRKKNLKANLINRLYFYISNIGKFDIALCFGNLPPLIKVDMRVITYFHQQQYLKIPKDVKFKKRLTLKLKSLFLKLVLRNTNIWIVQTQMIKQDLIKKFQIQPHKVHVAPFYPPFMKDGTTYLREKNSFFYVSGGNPHKNHLRLINAFCDFHDRSKTGSLTVTISEDDNEVLPIIKEKIKKSYPIKNIGFLERDELYQYYRTMEYLIFPSLAESFGLGLIEGIENGCKIIAADLPYVREVCVPSLLFDPYKVESISKAFFDAISQDLPQSQQRIFNEIEKIKSYLV